MAHWDPKKKDAGPEGSLYAAMLDAVRLTGGRVAGLFWYQGCSDTNGKDAPAGYEEATREFFAALRSDLHFPDMPVVMVQIAGAATCGTPDPACDARWSHVREVQRNFQNRAEKIAVVPACDLCYEDGIHLDQASQYVLGRRCGEAMGALLGLPGVPPMPIELEKMEYHLNGPLDVMEIEVTYRNVSGELSSGGVRSSGFAVVDADGRVIDRICAIRPHGNRVMLRLAWMNGRLPAGQKIAYAYGCSLNANITDSAGRSLPAFGPLDVQ